jgi:ABC-type transport system substrate-binding protein
MRSTRGAELACLLLCLLAGCPDLPSAPRYLGAGHSTPQRGGTLELWEEPRVRMLDPHVAFDQISSVLIDMLFDRLYTYDSELAMQPAIAAALPAVSADGLIITIPIRRGVRFHNGRALDAHEVLWSLERMLSPDLQSPGVPYFTAIAGLEEYQQRRSEHVRGLSTPDAYTLRIELSRPDQTFVYALAMHFAAPIARESAEGKNDPKRNPIGAGPFRLVSWDPGVRLVLERHRQYYLPGQPYLDRVVLEEGLKRDTAFLRFRAGEVDIVPRVAPADAMLLTTPSWRRYAKVGARLDTYGLAMNVQMPPFDNVHLRRAVAAAIDRERWSIARNRQIRPTGQMVPPKIPGYDAHLPHQQRFDLAKARAEMKLAGYPDGLPQPVTMWISDNSASRAYFELAQSDLAKIGIDLRSKSVAFPVYLQETGKPRTAQFLAVGWGLDFPDASNIFNLISKRAIAEQDSMNRSFFSDEHIETRLARAEVERDRDKRVALYREVNDLAADLAPWAFFCNTQSPQAWQPYVRGYAPHPISWMDVSKVWLDLPRKRVAGLERERKRSGRLASVLPFFDALFEGAR